MRSAVILWTVALCAFLILPSSCSCGDEPGDHLQFLAPLMNKEWIGHFAGGEHPEWKIVSRFKWDAELQAVKHTSEVTFEGFFESTHIRWDAERGTVSFIGLMNGKTFAQGIVQEESGKIVFRGEYFVCADSTLEFQTILEVEPKGTLRNTRLYRQDGKWVQWYVQEFVAKN